MLTVPEAARRTGKNPETIRRWIRAGRLRSEKVGTQHFVDEDDLARLTETREAELPPAFHRTRTGEVPPDWVGLVREVRDTR